MNVASKDFLHSRDNICIFGNVEGGGESISVINGIKTLNYFCYSKNKDKKVLTTASL